jgi:hypothetical protein
MRWPGKNLKVMAVVLLRRKPHRVHQETAPFGLAPMERCFCTRKSIANTVAPIRACPGGAVLGNLKVWFALTP